LHLSSARAGVFSTLLLSAFLAACAVGESPDSSLLNVGPSSTSDAGKSCPLLTTMCGGVCVAGPCVSTPDARSLVDASKADVSEASEKGDARDGSKGSDAVAVDANAEAEGSDAGDAGPQCGDTQTDPGNCGSCGHACGATETCVAGACAPVDAGSACSHGQTLCTPDGGASYCADTCTPCTSVLLISTSSAPPAGLVSGIVAAAPSICTFDYYDASSGTPSLGQVEPFDVVIAANANGVPYENADHLGNVLGSYFDGGGQVVVTLFGDGGYALGGEFGALYLLIAPESVPQMADSYASSVATQALVPGSPILAGVHSIIGTGAGWEGAQGVQNGGTAVAVWASGDVLAVTGMVTDLSGNPHNRVDLNILPDDIASGAWTGDGIRLLANAILYR
jgi:hypothetical protein